MQDELPLLLDSIDPATALFVFLDPFGLGVPMDLVGKILERGGELKYGYRTMGAPTEVLLNFSFPGLRRNAGHLVSDKHGGGYTKARQTFINKLDRTLGGDWWQEIWASEYPERDDLILRGYLDRLGKLPGGFGWWCVPVSNKWRGDPSYCLVQLTQYLDGNWEFHEALSNAKEPYRAACLEGSLELEPLADREAEWVAEIQANIEGMLGKGKSFVVQDQMSEVFGAALGSARSKHVRKAIKALHAGGKTPTNGVGDIQRMRVKPPA